MKVNVKSTTIPATEDYPEHKVYEILSITIDGKDYSVEELNNLAQNSYLGKLSPVTCVGALVLKIANLETQIESLKSRMAFSL